MEKTLVFVHARFMRPRVSLCVYVCVCVRACCPSRSAMCDPGTLYRSSWKRTSPFSLARVQSLKVQSCLPAGPGYGKLLLSMETILTITASFCGATVRQLASWARLGACSSFLISRTSWQTSRSIPCVCWCIQIGLANRKGGRLLNGSYNFSNSPKLEVAITKV